MGPRMPDQSRQTLLIKELIELRAVQNNVKNKLRKVLFSADPCKKTLNIFRVIDMAFLFRKFIL